MVPQFPYFKIRLDRESISCSKILQRIALRRIHRDAGPKGPALRSALLLPASLLAQETTWAFVCAKAETLLGTEQVNLPGLLGIFLSLSYRPLRYKSPTTVTHVAVTFPPLSQTVTLELQPLL